MQVHNFQLEYSIIDPKYWNIDNFVKDGGGCCTIFQSIRISQGAHKVPAKRSIFDRKVANDDRERENGTAAVNETIPMRGSVNVYASRVGRGGRGRH